MTEPLHEIECPSCGATIRASMADAQPDMSEPKIVREEPRYEQERMRMPRSGHEYRPMPVWHLDGVDWWKAPPPTVWHKHWAQTVVRMPDEVAYRCPCGAIGGYRAPWVLLDPPRIRPFWRRKWSQRDD
jgi:hypothetical protein